MDKVSYETHTPQEAADRIGNPYLGDSQRYFREKLYRGFKRAVSLADLHAANVLYDEKREVTLEEVMWNLKMNVELMERGNEDGEFDLTDEIIECFLLSLHHGRPVGEFFKDKYAKVLPEFASQRAFHKRNAILAQQQAQETKND